MKLIILTACLFSLNASACSLEMNFYVRTKNDVISYAASMSGADLSKTQISLNEYSHNIGWERNDPSYQCHDLDTVSAEVILKNFVNPRNAKETCTAVVKVMFRNEEKEFEQVSLICKPI